MTASKEIFLVFLELEALCVSCIKEKLASTPAIGVCIEHLRILKAEGSAS
jgi:hypothetical protein